MLFDPQQRRAFSALGKDIVPDVVAILATAANGASHDQIAKAAPDATADQIDGLVNAGLLSTTQPVVTCSTFVSKFHEANVDYPFFDYGSDEVAQNESQLLSHYDSLWSSPPPFAERSGPRFELPPTDYGFPESDGQPFPSIQALSQLLFSLLAPVGEIRTKYTTCLHKTTPSGGARHPTDVVWVSGRSMDGVPPGAFAYDAPTHSLVREPDKVDQVYRQRLGSVPFMFVVRSRVARAMWRYRDLRALRPLLIDVGHIVEMLSFLLAKAGVRSHVSFPAIGHFPVASLDEPELVAVQPKATSLSKVMRPRSGGQPSNMLRTNPAMVLRFDRTIAADVLWPRRKWVALDRSDFLVLNHCLPSTRGDRDCSYDGITEIVAGSDRDSILRLEQSGALLPATTADPLYKDIQLWVRHDWYLSLLALMESASDGGPHPVSSRIEARGDYTNNPGVLRARRTTRAFVNDAIPVATLQDVLQRAIANLNDLDLIVTVAALNVVGLPPALYSWHQGSLKATGRAIEPSEITNATAGQSAASGGAATVWLSLRSQPGRPSSYVMDLIDLGRAGQRLCEVATDLGIGVFLTPAAYDSQTCGLLGLDEPDRLLTYVFAFGVASPQDRQPLPAP